MTNKQAHQTDYTDKFGPLYSRRSAPPWPMYSYERPAYNFWNGVANYLRSQGKSDEGIRDTLQSKDARWLLDSFDARVTELGFELAKDYFGVRGT